MTTTDKSEKTEIANPDNASIKKSLALAAAHGIGPFRKRVRLDAPLPYEPEKKAIPHSQSTFARLSLYGTMAANWQTSQLPW